MPVHGVRMWGAIAVAVVVVVLLVVAVGCRSSSTPLPPRTTVTKVVHRPPVSPLVSHRTVVPKRPPLHKRIVQRLLHRKSH